MKAPRFSIFTLMAIVSVVALNLAAARLLIDYDDELLVGVALPTLVVQVGAFLLIRSRGRARAFWGGFVGLGVVAAISCYYGLFVAEESSVGAAWSACLDLIEGAVVRSGFTLRPDTTGTYFGLLQSVELALIVFLPQLAVALSGGLVASLLAWLTQLFRRRSALQPVPT